jgi:leader peptidase (prepilin peptidase)/N-methyltransferase
LSSPALAVTARWGTAWRRPSAGCTAAALAALALVRFDVSAHAFLMAFFVAVLVALSAIDIERRILPNVIVLPAAALVLAAQFAIDPGRGARFVLAAVAAAAILLLLFLINPAGMGMGDVKLAFLLGAGLGGGVIAALMVASLSLWPVAVVLFARHGRAARKSTIAFGPFLAFGAIVVAFIGS